MTEKIKPEYLGDGVYVEFDGYHIVLRLGSHTNDPVVFFEPDVMRKLAAYIDRIEQARNDFIKKLSDDAIEETMKKAGLE